MIKLTNQIGSLIGPVETTDAAFDDDVGRIMLGIKNTLGVLDPDDVLRIESILEKYCGGSGSVTNSMGSTRFGDPSDSAYEFFDHHIEVEAFLVVVITESWRVAPIRTRAVRGVS